MTHDKKTSVEFMQLILAYLVDQQAGQVTIPLNELSYKDCAVRIAINIKDETAVVTLITNEAANMPMPAGAIRLDI